MVRYVYLLVVWLVFPFSQLTFSAPVEYWLTLDAVLYNESGTWGGNLKVDGGAGQHINVTIIYTYEGTPAPADILPNYSQFRLISLQVLDNTNGLQSDVIVSADDAPLDGVLSICYDGPNDYFCGLGGYFPGGWVYPTTIFKSEFGEPGDSLPTGKYFDRLMNAGGIFAAARAKDYSDYILDMNSFSLEPNNYYFSTEGKTESNIKAILVWLLQQQIHQDSTE